MCDTDGLGVRPLLWSGNWELLFGTSCSHMSVATPYLDLHTESIGRSDHILLLLTWLSWNTQGVTSLLACGAGVLGLELVGLGGPLGDLPSFTELFLYLPFPAPGANGGSELCMLLVSDACLLALPSFAMPGYSSPKNPASFLLNLPLMLFFEPVEETVVALAIEGRLSSPSPEKLMPPGGAYPGDTCPRFSLLSL